MRPLPSRPAVRRSYRRAASLCLAAVAGVACTREREAAPRSGAGSAVATEAVPPPAPELSRFDAPLDYDFTPVLTVVERAVPRTFGSLDSLHQIGDDERKHYAYEATRGPFTAFLVGSEVHLRATLSYAARGSYKSALGPTLRAGCGKDSTRPEIVVELVTPLTLSPSWHLQSAARLARLAPASERDEDRCRVSILQYDVTDRVVDAARQALTTRLPDIDRKVARIDLTPRATRWWELLNRPIRLADDVWLLLQPQRLRVGRITGERHLLTVQAGLDAYPKIVTGPEPSPSVRPLPSLLAREASSSGFSILLDGNVDYTTASRALTDVLRGKTVTQAGHSVTVQVVTALPDTAGRVALTVGFTGDASGTLRFVGTPRYDAGRGQIVVPDLDYDLNTDSDIVNAVAWIRSDALRTLFREKAQVPVAPVLARGKALLTNGLNRTIGGTMTLSATVDSVAVRGLYVTRPGLVVRAGAAGHAQLSVRQKR